MQTIQELTALAIRMAGSQNKLRQAIFERFGVKTTQQSIAYLKNHKGKLAQKSSLTPYIAAIAGYDADWSPGRNKITGAVVRSAKNGSAQSIEPTPEEVAMDITREASELLSSWFALPATERARRRADIDASAKKHRENGKVLQFVRKVPEPVPLRARKRKPAK